MILYPWSCHACTETNFAVASTCHRCGCPAAATFAQVEVARQRWHRGKAVPASSTAKIDPFAQIAAWPLLQIGAATCGGIGAIAASVSGGSSGRAFGGLMLALAALFVSSMRPKPAPAVDAPLACADQ